MRATALLFEDGWTSVILDRLTDGGRFWRTVWGCLEGMVSTAVFNEMWMRMFLSCTHSDASNANE